MAAAVIDGRAIAREVGEEIRLSASELTGRGCATPTVAVVRAGQDPGSVWYANAIRKAMKARGMAAQLHVLDESAPQARIIDLVSRLCSDPDVHGVLIQEPLPSGIDEGAVKAALSPEKDVDGVHEINAGRLVLAGPSGRPSVVGTFFVPATPLGGLELLKRCGIEIAGRNAVVVGRSPIVGKPMGLLLLREHATVTICHSRTDDLREVCRRADILCVAVGRPEMVRGDWIKPGAVVIDFGVNDVDGKMFGDVAYEEAAAVAGMITPVPGGTGPMTNVMLCRNVLEATRRQISA
jgi:methylenetetrahydrofolate dehydrogenase (NADP+) / methenyltetrahydrofolate cyclohydrolase